MANTSNLQTAAGASNCPPVEHVAPHPHRPTGLRKFFAFLGWVFSGFGLIGMFRRKGEHYRIEEVVVYSVHKSFFLWPIILIGFIGAWIINHRINYVAHHNKAVIGDLPHVMGWVYIWVLLYTFVVMLFDVGTFNFLIWGLIFGFVLVLSKYFEAVRNISLLSGVFHYLQNLRPELDPGFATVLSWLLLGPWVGSLFRTFSRGRKSFTPNGIEEWFLGDGREITDRAGLHFTSRYTDLFKMILGFGSGDLEATDGMGKVVKRWQNILFLTFVWNKLDEIIHERAAVVENSRDEPVEVVEARPAGTPGGRP